MKKIYISLLTLMIATWSFAQTSNISVGTLDPGDSIVIYYDVTINNPCGCTSVTNQGTVSGSNFSSFSTDDPDTGPLNDPTITPLNLVTLPVTLTELKAYYVNNTITVDWKVVLETDIEKYEVERSADGRAFVKIGEVTALGTSGTINYSFPDISPLNPVNFYRLKIIDRTSGDRYTTIVRVDLSSTVKKGIRIFPNPVQNKMTTLQMDELPQGQYQLALYNNMGQITWSHSITHNGGSASTLLQLPANIAAGTYMVKLQKENLAFSQCLMVK